MVRGILQDKNLNTTMPLFWADRTNLPPITEPQDPFTFRRTAKGNVFNTNTKKDLNNSHPITIEVLYRPKVRHNAEPGVYSKDRIKHNGSTRCATPTPKHGFTPSKVSSLKDAQRPCERPKLRKTVSCSIIRPAKEEHCKSQPTDQTRTSRENSATCLKSTLNSSRTSSNEPSNKIRPRPVTGRTTKCVKNNESKKISFAQDEDVSQITPEIRKQTSEQFLDVKTKNRIMKWLTEVETARKINETKTESRPKLNKAKDTTESNDSEQTLPMIDEEDAISSIH